MHFLVIMSHTNARYRSEENSPVTELMSNKAVYRTAPATPGLYTGSVNNNNNKNEM